MSDKPQFPRALAIEVAKELCDAIRPHCATSQMRLGHQPLEEPKPMLMVCGSLRRRKETVGDVEIVFITRHHEAIDEEPGLFGTFKTHHRVPMVHTLLDVLVKKGVLEKRLNKDGRPCWGAWNRLAVHAASGVPVDFFATTFDHWWMSVVVRTGPKELNKRLAESAIKNGLNLHAYPDAQTAAPFTLICNGEAVLVDSERAVFEKAGVPWLEPWERRL